MNITEANTFNTLLDWVLDTPGPNGNPVTSDQARDAAATLAERAHRVLLAGATPEQVHANWPADPPPAGPTRGRGGNTTSNG